ncbi:MAG: dimethylarginine dimethylaminohydrolase family protein [Candidatus Heimdallarchaeaceae archaeon]
MNRKVAIVREPGKSYTSCITSHPLGHTVNLTLAREQHKNYCNILSELGLELIKLPPKDDYPDSCFVEDNAVVHGNRAFITRMAKKTRRGEEEEVEEVLSNFFETKKATAPAIIEGGDVVHLPKQLICGITQRTNYQGVEQMKNWLKINVQTIINPKIMHLKSYMKYLGRAHIITTEEYENHPLLRNLKKIVVPKEEYYSVNCLAVGKTIIMSDKFSKAQRLVEERGFEVISLNMSEFEKCQGSLTCLSIIF